MSEPSHEIPTSSAQTPVSRVADTVARLGRPAGLLALASGAGGFVAFLLSHAVTIKDVAEVARAGWREIAMGTLFVVLLIVLRHVHKLQTEWAALTRMFAGALAANQRQNEANQRINEEQNRVLARIEVKLGELQAGGTRC